MRGERLYQFPQPVWYIAHPPVLSDLCPSEHAKAHRYGLARKWKCCTKETGYRAGKRQEHKPAANYNPRLDCCDLTRRHRILSCAFTVIGISDQP